MPAQDGIHVGNYLKDHNARVDPTPAICPYHPMPVPLPSPLPANISKALTNLTESLKLVVNGTSGVSTCLNHVICNILYECMQLCTKKYAFMYVRMYFFIHVYVCMYVLHSWLS